MFRINKAKKFDGAGIIMDSEDFDTIINSINYTIQMCKEKDYNSIAYERLRKVLTQVAYFDIEKEEVHVQLGYSELATFMNSMLICCNPPIEESQYNF